MVDDDRAVRESLRRSLSFNGYTVDLAEDGVEALDAIANQRPDGLVLDVMMPRMDGLEVCRQLRSSGDDLPILVLTARDSVSERVAGLDAGADDYLPKPFALEELLARLRALLRRTGPEEPTESAMLSFADLTLDPGTREVHRGNEMTGNEDPEFAHVDARASSIEVLTYAMQMAAIKAKDPGDDIVTALINADVDGEKLTDDEFAFFVLMLAVAGSETTRNSITHGMIAFIDNPDQWELYKRERPATAADEIVRWATPVTAFQRTAVKDTELGGVPIKEGQRVVMFYRSANFDEEVFDDPHTFNILRDPNPHVGFGGTGVHYCLGANLARMTIDLMFNAIADTMPDLSSLGTPERLRSGWLNGIKHWQVDYSGTAAS